MLKAYRRNLSQNALKCLGYTLFLAGVVCVDSVLAGEIYLLRVSHKEGVYLLAIEARIEASPESVFASLTDYENLTQISSSVIESGVLEEFDAKQHRVYLATRLCILFYCATIKQTQDMTSFPPEKLSAQILPQQSDFRQGAARWRLNSINGATRMLFNASLEPDFWIPPLIGPLLVKHMLRKEAIKTIAGLERIHHNREEM